MSLSILIIHPYHHICGPDTFIINIIKSLMPEGYKFTVAMGERRPLVDILHSIDVDVQLIPGLQTFPRTVSPFRLGRYLLETRGAKTSLDLLCHKLSVDVVHAINETMWPPLIGLRREGIGRIVSVHGMKFTSPVIAGYLNAVLLNHFTDRIVCVSRAVLNIFQNWNIPDDKLEFIPSSVNLQQYCPDVSGVSFREEIQVGHNVPLIGTVGSVDERKGLIYFVEACKNIQEEFPAAHFVIVGIPTSDFPLHQIKCAELLQNRVLELGLGEKMHFLPPRNDIPEVMAALDVLVQPSLTEAAPRAPLEAMAMKCAVVGTRVGGMVEEVVDGETGILVEPANSEALACAVSELLHDHNKRDRLRQAGRTRVEQHFSMETTRDHFIRLYTQVAMMRGAK